MCVCTLEQCDVMIQVQIMTELSSHYLPATLKKLQDMVVKNSSGSGWIVGQNVSL